MLMELEGVHACDVLTTLEMSASVTLKGCNAYILLPWFMDGHSPFSVTIPLVKCTCVACAPFASTPSPGTMAFVIFPCCCVCQRVPVLLH